MPSAASSDHHWLADALRRVGTAPAFARHVTGGTVKVIHPVPGYTGPVRGPIRLDFVNGEAEAANVKASVRKALEDAGFRFESTRAAKADDGQ